MKDGVCQGVKLKATELAIITITAFDSMKLARLVAVRANLKASVTVLKNFIQTGIIIRVFLVKLFDCELFGHRKGLSLT